jgi:HD-GYP domain-containing protein (c-di-GMP phosphodiesterase class II)
MVIKTKIVAVVALTIILAAGLTASVVFNIQNKKMLDDKLKDMVFIGDVIERSIDNEMREGHKKHVQAMMENFGRNKEILNLRILSPEGTILRSSNPAELGTASQDYVKSLSSASSWKPAVIDKTTINYYKKIPNREECYGCHSSQQMVNGIIQIKLDISRSLLAILSLKRLFVFSIFLIVLLVCGILSILFSHLVIKPLRNLLSTIHDVESGNWNATVNIKSSDELETIGTSFNKMIREINKLYKKDIDKERELSRVRLELEHKSRHEELNTQLEFKIKELEAANRAITSLSKEVKGKNIDLEKAIKQLKKINEVSRILSSIIDPEELLKIITRTSADLLNTQRAVLHINKDMSSTLQYQKESGLESLDSFPYDLNSHFMELLSYGKQLFLPQAGDQAGDNGQFVSLIGVPLQIKAQVIGAMILEDKADSTAFTKEDLSLLTTLSNHAVVAIENAWLYKSFKDNYFATIQSLVNALEASDRFTKGHSERVRFLSLELGRHIGLDFKELEILEQASILHDIGKIGIESFILQKQGKLTPNEYSMIKAHPLIGEEILGPIDSLTEVRQIIIQHHERYDGKGYPYGLRGDELSLKAKILAVVDTFDAMMSDRPYRKALSMKKIKQEVIDHSGTQFDPYIVESFIELLDLKGGDILSTAGYYTFQSVPKE